MPDSKVAKGLGRGFDSLIPANFDSSLLLDENERVQKIALGDIHPNPDQPRKHFDKEALDELGESIKRHGVIQPLIVSPAKDGFILVAGERRWRAANLAGLKSAPVIIRTAEELEQLEIALVENVQRVDLDPIEQAISIQRLHDQFNIGYSEIAKRLGKAETTISNVVRLLQLPEAAREALQKNHISEGHARAILALKGRRDKQLELLKLIQAHNWSVRQAEQFVSALKSGVRSGQKAKSRTESTTPDTDRLSRLIAAPVTVRRTAKGGKLEIGFNSEADLKKLIERIAKGISKTP